MPRELDAYAVDRMAALPKVPALVLDLTDTVFIKPAGMTVLYWLLQRLRGSDCLVRVEIGLTVATPWIQPCSSARGT